MKIWLEDKKNGLQYGINDDGELFFGGRIAPDKPENREMFVRSFCSMTGAALIEAEKTIEGKKERLMLIDPDHEYVQIAEMFGLKVAHTANCSLGRPGVQGAEPPH